MGFSREKRVDLGSHSLGKPWFRRPSRETLHPARRRAVWFHGVEFGSRESHFVFRLPYASLQSKRDSNDSPPPTFSFPNRNSHRAYVPQNHETPNDEIGAPLLQSQGRTTYPLAVAG
jgi:hypothetical protein